MFVKAAIETGASQVLTLPRAHPASGGQTFVLLEKAPGEYARRPIRRAAEFDGVSKS